MLREISAIIIGIYQVGYVTCMREILPQGFYCWLVTHLGHLCDYRDGVATGENKLCCGRRSFFKILKPSQHSAKFSTYFTALLRMSEKYNVASSLRRNVRLILVKTSNRMDNFKGTTSSCDACAR